MRVISTAIVWMLFSLSAQSQLKHSLHFYRRGTNPFCGEFILLDSTGLFFREAGCESEQYVTFVKYKIAKGGRLAIRFLPLDRIVPVKEIRDLGKRKDSIVTVFLFDREEKPLPFSFGLVLVDTAGKYKEWLMDKDGEVSINRFQYKTLILAQLDLVFKNVEPVPITDHSVEIHFNLPNDFMSSSETKIGKPAPLHLILKREKLYDLNDKRHPYKLVK